MKAFLVLLLLCGCAKQVPLRDAGEGPGYFYEKIDNDYFLVARNQAARSRAISEICKGKICTFDVIGEAYLVRIEGSKP